MNLPHTWKHGTLCDVISSVRGGFSVQCEDRAVEDSEIGVLKTGAVLTSKFDPRQNKYVPPEEHSRLRTSVLANTIIICRKNSEETIGASALVERNYDHLFLSDLLWELRPSTATNSRWLAYVLQSDSIRSMVRLWSTGTQSTMKNISQDRLLEIPVGIPTKREQHAIATILQTWDEAIEKLEDVSQKLGLLQGALRQRIFEREYESGLNLRHASALFEPVSEKARPDLPLLAVMQDLGVVRRDQLDRRVAMPDGDTSTYKVVRPGDFVISLRSFEGGLEYSNVLGLVSPAYTVLRPMREIHSDYYRHFFKSRSFIGRLNKLIFGIRDGKQIAFRDFGDMRIPNPPLEVQQSAAGILNDAQSQIEINQTRKQYLERQKRGLMQKLLTGQWRVKV